MAADWHALLMEYLTYMLLLTTLIANCKCNFEIYFLGWNVFVSNEIPQKYVYQCLDNKKSALILVMAWHQTSSKPIPEAMLTQFTEMNYSALTHWGRATHICVGKLTIIGSDNGLSPGRRQAIIWTNAGILLIGPLGTNFNEMLIEIYTFSFKKIHLKMSSAK